MESKLRAEISSKGEVEIPLPVRGALGIDTASWVEFVEFAPGRYEIRVLTRSIRELKGMFKSDRPPVTIKEMNEMIAKCGAASGLGLREDCE